MIVRIRFAPVVSFVALVLLGCTDKAKPAYARCLQLDLKPDTAKAWEACNDAVSADPMSESGKAATSKLAELRPKYDAWKKEDEAKRARAAEEQRKRDDVARAMEALPADCPSLCEKFVRRRAECSDNFTKTIPADMVASAKAAHQKDADGRECPNYCWKMGNRMTETVKQWGRCAVLGNCADFHACFKKAAE